MPKGQGRVYVLVNDKPGEEKEEAKQIAQEATDGGSMALEDHAKGLRFAGARALDHVPLQRDLWSETAIRDCGRHGRK